MDFVGKAAAAYLRRQRGWDARFIGDRSWQARQALLDQDQTAMAVLSPSPIFLWAASVAVTEMP